MPKPVEGHIVPGPSTPFIQVLKPWGWETHRLQAGIISDEKWGPPIKPEPVVKPEAAKPKEIGDEHKKGLMDKLSALVAQHTTQITDALPCDRQWR